MIRNAIVVITLIFFQSKLFAQKTTSYEILFTFTYIYDRDSVKIYIDNVPVYKDILTSDASTATASSFGYTLDSGIHKLCILMNGKETLFYLDVDKLPSFRWVEITKDTNGILSLMIPKKMILKD